MFYTVLAHSRNKKALGEYVAVLLRPHTGKGLDSVRVPEDQLANYPVGGIVRLVSQVLAVDTNRLAG